MKRLNRIQQVMHARRGAIMVLAAVIMTIMLGFVAYTIDVGFIQLTKTQLQTAADAAALAGAMELSATSDPATVRSKAVTAIQVVAGLHRNGDQNSVTIDPIADVTFGKVQWDGASQNYKTYWGNDQSPYSIVKVRAMRTGTNKLPLFFAPVIGSKMAEVGAEAIATFQARDIMVVLDFSASMNDDSCFGAIGKLGRSYIESNLQTMWSELGSPVYGNLTFTPAYATLKGRAAAGTIPHIDVTYKRTSVSVTSTLALSQVKLQFSNGGTQTLTGLSGLTGNFSGSGNNASKDIVSCWVKSGTNASLSSGNTGEQFDFTTANIKSALGLTTPYPYAGGSWDEFIQNVQSTSGSIKDAGYRDMFGYMNWIEYLQTKHPSVSDTSDLWKTSEQPVGSMKNAVGYFIDYLKMIEAQDQMGLAIYTHTDSSGAYLEHGLSNNMDRVKTTTLQRQAGHYTGNTNISAGMKAGRDELVSHARPRAFRMMVLMTDGVPNLPGSASVAKAAVITEANACAADKIRILTISLGLGADTALMQQVADITGGIHFNVPGGSNINTLKAQLEATFRQIASSRPLKLTSGK